MIRRESSFTIRRRDLLAALLGGSLVVAGAIAQRLSTAPESKARAIGQFARAEAAARPAVDSPGSRYLPVSTTYTPASTTLAASTTRRAARPRRLPPVPRVAQSGLALPAVPDKPLLLPPLIAPRIPSPVEQSAAEATGSNPVSEQLPPVVKTEEAVDILPSPGTATKAESADSKGADSTGNGVDPKATSGQGAAAADPAKATPPSNAAAGGTTPGAVKPLTEQPAGATKASPPPSSAASPGGAKGSEQGSGGEAATKSGVKVEPASPSDQEKRQAAGGTGAEAEGLMTEERVQPMRDLPDPMTPLPGYGEPFAPIPSGPVVDLPLIRRDGDGDGGTCDDAPPLQIWRGGYLKDPLRTFPIRLPNP